MDSLPVLNNDQLDSLFEILIHQQISNEISGLRRPETFENFGFPLQPSDEGITPSSPILRLILETLVVPLPGYKNLSPEFWSQHVYSILRQLAEFQLSKSYDSGAISARTTATSLLSVLLEYPTFLILRGPPADRPQEREDYDLNNAADLEEAWKVFLCECIYNDRLGQLLDTLAQTPKIKAYSPLAQAAHRYIVLSAGGLIHYLSLVPPGSAHIVNSIISTHKTMRPVYPVLKFSLWSTPRFAIDVLRSTLLSENRVVSAVSGYLRKPKTIQVPSFKTAIQCAGYQLLAWDLSDIEEELLKIRANQVSISEKQWLALDNFVDKSSIRDECRKMGADGSTFLVNQILDYHELDPAPPAQIPSLAQYLKLKLAVHNRVSLLKTFCNQDDPNFLTMLNQLTQSFMEIVGMVHQTGGLNTLLGIGTSLLDGYARLAQTGLDAKDPAGLPQISDFVTLVDRSMDDLNAFLHAVMKGAPKVRRAYQAYTQEVASAINPSDQDAKSPYHGLAKRLEGDVQAKYQELSESDRESLVKTLDQYTAYRKAASKEAQAEFQKTIDGKFSTHPRSGCFGKVTDHLDEITSSPQFSANASAIMPRSGTNTPDDEGLLDVKAKKEGHSGMISGTKRPDAGVVTSLFGQSFHSLLSAQVKSR